MRKPSEKLVIAFSGHIWHAALDAIKLLTSDPYLMKMTLPPTGINAFLCQVFDEQFLLSMMVEQEAFQSSNDLFLKMTDVAIFFFNLSRANESKSSYDVTKRHIQHCRDRGIKLYLVGFWHDNTENSDALAIFEKFRAEQNLDDHILIFDSTDQGKEKFLKFFQDLCLEHKKERLSDRLEEEIDPDDISIDSQKPWCVML